MAEPDDTDAWGGRAGITRDTLTPERIDRIIAEAASFGFRYFLTHEERAASLRETLQEWTPGEDVWMFGYGSLMWNPAFHFVEKRTAKIVGWKRSFCFWTPLGRGSPEMPGLMLALEAEAGCGCEGVAYRIAADAVETELAIVWSREMLSGVYKAVWVEAEDREGRRFRALTFVVNPEHPQYAGGLPIEVKARHIAFAEGRLGPCRDYLSATAEQLAGLGVSDPYIDALGAEVLRQRLEKK
jgi:cation transport protein ChaC